MIITVHRYSSGFGNIPDTISLIYDPNNEHYCEAINVELPEGYKLSHTKLGDVAIFDADGEYCELCLTSDMANAISCIGKEIRILRIVPDEEGNDEAKNSLRNVRSLKNLTQRELADAAGINIRQIQKIESGEIEFGNITARNAVAIADALGVDVRRLI